MFSDVNYFFDMLTKYDPEFHGIITCPGNNKDGKTYWVSSELTQCLSPSLRREYLWGAEI